MSFTNLLALETNLTYALVVDPTPLQVSLAGTDSSSANLQLVITNQHAQAVTIKEIEVTLLVGPDAASLTDLTSAALDAVWEPHQPWTVEPPRTIATGKNTYTLMASDSGTGELEAGDSIVLTFVGVPINEALGTTTLSLIEKTSLGAGTLSYDLAKFPYGFSFENLRVLDPQSGAVVSQVRHGAPVRLAWEGSVNLAKAYQVFYSTIFGQQIEAVQTVGQWDLLKVFQDTVFNVQVTIDDASGQPVTHTLTTSVAVAQPDLSVTTLSLGDEDLAGRLATMARSLVPKGTIAMWSGQAMAIPAGWALCDGTAGTPDLRRQFIRGADPAGGLQPNSTGGSASHSHLATSNVAIAQTGAHTHGVPSTWYSNTASSGKTVTIVDRDRGEVKGAQTQSAGEHTHSASAVVSVSATETLPPWYALCFIIKTI